MRFNIKIKDSKFILENISLSSAEEKYLQLYINKVNQFKIIGYSNDMPVHSLHQPPISSLVGNRYLEGKLAQKFRKEKIPESITISITKNCQCDCEHCHFTYFEHSVKNNLKLDEFKEAMRQAVELGVTTIILSGGEPLLRKGLYKLIESVDKDKANVILYSNGDYLTFDRCKKLASAGIYGIFVAFDSWIDEEYEQYKNREGVISKAVEAIENINRAGILSGITTFFSSDHLKRDHFEKFVEFAKRIDAKELAIQDYNPTCKALRNESRVPSEFQKKIIQDLNNKFKKKQNYPAISFKSIMIDGDYGLVQCSGGSTHFYLTAAGEMCPCEYMPISIGKFPERSIRFLWAKMGITKPFASKSKSCRMQDPDFHKDYINQIPDSGPFPYPMDRLEKV